MREVRVYDGDFPAMEQLLSGDPTITFPKEVWLSQLHPGEFAVRYKDFKTGLPRNPEGKSVKSSEVRRIFSSVEEARADSTKVSDVHWVVRCFVYDQTGAQVETISNEKRITKFAAVVYAGIFLWIGLSATAGMIFLWLLSVVALAAVNQFSPGHELSLHFGLWGWTAYTLAGLLLGIFGWYLRIQLLAKLRVARMRKNLSSMTSPEERKRFEELNVLYGSEDPEKRERFLKLAAEYQEVVKAALRKQ